MISFCLGIDSTTPELKIVLASDAHKELFIEPQLSNQDNQILTVLSQVLQKNDLHLSDCEYIGYISGPGSFTGTRMCASVIQAINLSRKIPIVRISKLHLLAQQAWLTFKKDNVTVLLDALRGEYFFAEYAYDANANVMQLNNNEQVTSKELGNLIELASFTITDSVSMKTNNVRHVGQLDWYMEAFIHLMDICKNKDKLLIKGSDVLPSYLKMPHIFGH